MSGIFGYLTKKSNKNASQVLFEGLHALDFCGYDSAGIAVFDEENHDYSLVQSFGTVDELQKKIKNEKISLSGNLGLSLTKWTTHNGTNLKESHPYRSDDFNLVGFYNGIVHKNASSKSEVLINLIDEYYNENRDPVQMLTRAMREIDGSFSVGIVFIDDMSKMWFAKKDSTLAVAVNKDSTEYYLSSDLLTFAGKDVSILNIDEKEFGYLSINGIKVFDSHGIDITNEKQFKSFNLEKSQTSKGKYPYFLLKEIEEQPKVIKNTVNKYVINKKINLGIPDEILESVENVYFVGAGSSYNACLVGQAIAAKYVKRIHTRAILSSEFIYFIDQIRRKNSAAIFISQSGETQDMVVALDYCKLLGLTTIALVNNKTSRLAQDADYVLYTQAYPEVSIANTKVYSSQLVLIYLLGIQLNYLHRKNTEESNEDFAASVVDKYVQKIRLLPNKIEKILEQRSEIQKLAFVLANKQNMYLVGGNDFATCAEGAQKLKEICGIHAEALPVGELSHGSIVLINSDFYTILISTGVTNSHEVSGAAEIRSRGGKLISIISTHSKNQILKETSDYCFEIALDEGSSMFIQSCTVIYVQLLAYYIALYKGIDPDKPRNLARSITVE